MDNYTKNERSRKMYHFNNSFLEEADVLSDRIAIMTNGRLQANGTPDFLKQQTGLTFPLSCCNND